MAHLFNTTLSFFAPKYLLVFKAYSECQYDCCDKTISQGIACKLS